MKRDNTNISFSTSNSSTTWQHNQSSTTDNNNNDVDELFAVLGYKVKSSDMADVAQKLHHLEQAYDNNTHQFSDDTSHYNPSDLSSFLESMLTNLDPQHSHNNINNTIPSSLDFGSELQSIIPPPPPQPQPQPQPPAKKLKPEPSQTGPSIQPVVTARPVLIDSQENGVMLVHTLMGCAEAVESGNFNLAEALLKNIGFLAVSQAGAMRKVATYFAEALARRIYGLYPVGLPDHVAFTDSLQMHFYETCPYLKFAHFTANQAILEAFAGKSRVHVIDFSMKQGMQWPALLQALALRPGGPPVFRLTGVGPPSGDDTDHLQEVGWKLARFAETINVEFEYRGFVANSLADLKKEMFDVRGDETVAVNSIFEMHQLLARVGGIENVLELVKGLKPTIMTVVEQEANHNGAGFLDRFTESLHYYSTLFDSLESCGGGEGSEQDKVMSEVYLGRQICNVVASEGVDRVERHETLDQWRARFGDAGFRPVHLGSIAYKQASTLLALFAGGDGYRVEENNGCLMLGWHTRPLIATSAWRPS